MMNCDTKAIGDWLAAGARSAPDAEDMVGQLCDRLVGCEISLSRVGLFVLTLHPQIMGRRYLWEPGRQVDVSVGSFEAFETPDFRRSPVRHAIDTGAAIRLRLAEEGPRTDLTVVNELRAEGATDYLVTPLVFTDGSTHAASWATRQPGGFTDAEIAGLNAILNPLARMIEISTLRRLARDFLDIYVGNQGGSRILSGQIRRGHTEAINACIWLSDMRGFTALSERLSPQRLVDLINRFFDCQTPAILKRGGEVLKFMGDGLLAIFPIVGDRAQTSCVCEAALAAAIEASATVAAQFGSSGDDRAEDVRFGLALHLGQVMYGNIGGGNRLDFTCIGPAVNLAARIEKLCSQLERTILASDEFAEHCSGKLAPVGNFDLRGIDGRRTVFGLEGEAVLANR
jgi:adenylate cyclase